MGWREGDVTVDGTRIHYYRRGQGRPLVLAHGMWDNGRCWGRVAAAIEGEYEIIAYDARYHGLSGGEDGGQLVGGADLVGVVEALALDRPAIMGHSMGARTVAEAAGSRPELFRCAVLEDPPWMDARPQAPAGAAMPDFAAMTVDQLIAFEKPRSPMWDDDEFPAWAESKRQFRPQKAWTRWDVSGWRDAAKAIGVPTLLVYGDNRERGALVSAATADEAAALNPADRDGAHGGRRPQHPPRGVRAVRGGGADVPRALPVTRPGGVGPYTGDVSRVFASIAALAGNTPLVELRSLSPEPDVRLFAKLEGWNPTGSIKDRIVVRILEAARASGALEPGQRIVEASTGNTGVALAMFGRALGHPVDVCVPESVYPEIEELLHAYGANVIRVPRQAGIKTAREVAMRRAKEQGAYYLGQFDSPENARAHYEGTAAEILADLPQVDVFVAGMGTGGTITGVGRRLKEANPGCHVLGVEPRLGVHVQGLKSLEDGFIPPVLDESVLDGKIIVGNRHAFSHARRAMLAEGLFGGISSGAVLHAALRAASRIKHGNVVMVFADAGWKYLGTDLWSTVDVDPAFESHEDPLDDVLWW